MVSDFHVSMPPGMASETNQLNMLLALQTQGAATIAGQAQILAALQAPPIRPGSVLKIVTAYAAPTALASKVIAPANPNRKGLIIFNNSANSCYVSLEEVSTAARCAWIIPTFQGKDFFPSTMYTGAVSAIRNAGTGGDITVWEFY